MVKINRIYTRTGDNGTTGLVGGSRVHKTDLRIRALGDIDELNAMLGLARALMIEKKLHALRAVLDIIQQELFDLGAEVATPPGEGWEGMPQIAPFHHQRLEQWIDALHNDLPELRSFVLPGGSPLVAQLHVARAVCRRAERSLCTPPLSETISQEVLTYMNRLSDMLFAACRYVCAVADHEEILWKPGASRGSEVVIPSPLRKKRRSRSAYSSSMKKHQISTKRSRAKQKR
jgi:cob(I)alamin adenosyltransferase